MPTNEAGVVASIQRAILEAYPGAWIFKVVGSPFQMSGVPDLLAVVEGHLFGLEVKYQRPGESRAAALERATPGQQVQILRLRRAGAVAGVVTTPAEALALIRTVLQLSYKSEKES